MAALKNARADGDAAAIETANRVLALGTEAFAALRMNRGIQKARLTELPTPSD